MKKNQSVRLMSCALALSLTLSLSLLNSCGEKKESDETEQTETVALTATVSYNEGDKIIIADKNGCAFRLIRPDSCSDTVKNAAVKLRGAIMDICGDMPTLTTDYAKNNKAIPEILIGKTSRSASEQASDGLASKDYVIKCDGATVTVTGGSDDAIAEAVDYLITNYIKDGEFQMTCGDEYKFMFEYPKLNIAGNEISEYVIYSNGVPQKMTDELSAAIADMSGALLDVTDKKPNDTDKYINFGVDTSVDKQCYYAKLKGNTLLLTGDTQIGAACALNRFKEALNAGTKPGETLNLSLDASSEYPAPFAEAPDSAQKYFLCITDKPSLSYEKGEQMNFEISLLSGGELASCEYFVWTMTGDDGKSSSGSVSGCDGVMKLSTTLNTDGFVMILVKACDANGNEINSAIRFSGGAGVHPENLSLTVKEPDDFDEFWEKALKEMNGVKPEILEMDDISSTTPGYKTFKMKIACVGNKKWTGETYVSGYLSYPVYAKEKSLGIRAGFQGYGVASPSVGCVEGYINFSVCAHSIEIGMESSYYSDLQSGKLNKHGWLVEDNQNADEVYFKYMILRDLQALRFMKEYFGDDGNGLWNGKNVDLSGASQGGFQVFALAALDHNVTSVSAGVPWLCDIGGYTNGSKIKSSFRPDFTAALGYFDTVSFGARVECPVNIGAGLGDTLCPPAGVAALYNGLKCKKSLQFGQNRTHSYNPPEGDKFNFTAEAK